MTAVTNSTSEWHLQPAYLDSTTGHPSTSFTTAALLSCLEELNTTVDKAVELGVWKVIKLIAWGRMSSCNVPSPDTSSLPLTASSFIIFFWSHLGLNCLSPLSPPLLQISLIDPSDFCQEQYLTQSKCHLKNFEVTSLCSGVTARSRGWLTGNDQVSDSTIHKGTSTLHYTTHPAPATLTLWRLGFINNDQVAHVVREDQVAHVARGLRWHSYISITSKLCHSWFFLFRFAEINIIHCIYHFNFTLKFRNNFCGLHPNVDCKLKLPLAKSNLPHFVKLHVPNTITLPLMVKYTGRLRGL